MTSPDTGSWLYAAAVGLFVLERIHEILLARRNAKHMADNGYAVHDEGWIFPAMLLLHAAWFAALIAEPLMRFGTMVVAKPHSALATALLLLLLGGAYFTAIIGSFLNAALLRARIRRENTLLGKRADSARQVQP